MKNKAFGQKLRALRKERNISIKALGDKTGISYPYLSQIETANRQMPKLQTLEKIAEGLEMPILQLLLMAEYINLGDVIELLDMLEL